jgi:hypothetical protein
MYKSEAVERFVHSTEEEKLVQAYTAWSSVHIMECDELARCAYASSGRIRIESSTSK